MKDVLDRAVTATSPLVGLLSDGGESLTHNDRRVGFTLSMDYDGALVMIHDRWRSDVDGIPHNSYLLGATFNPAAFMDTDPIDRRVVLLRVIGRSKIETDQEHLRAITQFFQENPGVESGRLEGLEPITVNRMCWSGSDCRILGTFFLDQNSDLRMGTDVEDVFATRMMKVYKPTASALEKIVNYVDPDRRRKAVEDAKAAGFGVPIDFEIGTVRYTSTQHMAERGGSTKVPVRVSPADFLARRTAVFGMTRTGKSNTTKTMVSQVATTAFQTKRPIGQLIFDINGEYANANDQDQGSAINDVFPDNTVRYRVGTTDGFEDLRSNFYDDLPMAIELIGKVIEDQGRAASSNDLKNFLSVNLEKPDEADRSAMNRWRRRSSIVRAVLYASGYEPSRKNTEEQEIELGKVPLADLLRKGREHGLIKSDALDDLDVEGDDEELAAACRDHFGLTQTRGSVHIASLEDAKRFWMTVRNVERESGGYDDDTGIVSKKETRSRPGTPWLDEEERSLLSVLAGKSTTTDQPIITKQAIGAASDYHGPGGSDQIAQDVYRLLHEGRIVILDLSVGSPTIREKLSEKLVREIFRVSSNYFNRGRKPPPIVMYVEEAHNLIGKKAELTHIWPRIAKEGAKYGIALVYATQEPSSIHPNILANTENFFVTHLNNDAEIKALSGFYDFADFGAGLKRSQDVGFARIKTLSANFVTPTQILKFDPNAVRARYAEVKQLPDNGWFKPMATTSN